MISLSGLNLHGLGGSRMKSLRSVFSRAASLFVAASLSLALVSNSALAKSKPSKITTSDAARFLTQSSFGPTSALISQVQRSGFTNFLNQQFSTSSTLTVPRVDAAIAALPAGTDPSNPLFQEAWWYTVVNAPDQLRQRVAFALSEIMVISANGNSMYQHPEAMATYWDVLTQDAFGNFRQLLEDVTLNPAMGDYLDMVHNDKPNPRRNTEPNENYAREIMQLFTIGLYKLNQDGSQQLDINGQPIPTYDQDVVEGNAHVFTGWYWYQTGTPTWGYVQPNYRQPMMAFAEHHDTGAKTILNGVTLPAGQTQAQDLKNCLDTIFNHSNVGPFVARRLIQRLVTSNPSPAYIARIAKVFANNGHSVRGDMKAVVQSILLDSEARSSSFVSSGDYVTNAKPSSVSPICIAPSTLRLPREKLLSTARHSISDRRHSMRRASSISFRRFIRKPGQFRTRIWSRRNFKSQPIPLSLPRRTECAVLFINNRRPATQTRSFSIFPHRWRSLPIQLRWSIR